MLNLPRTIEWVNGRVRLINQKLLPHRLEYIETSSWERVVKAIKDMEIRGAPAIGVAAAYAVALFAVNFPGENLEAFMKELERVAGVVKSARPTAVNLSWAVNRVVRVAMTATSVEEARKVILEEAVKIHREDEEANRRIGELGEQLISDGDTIITVCNAGSLATSYWGTATAPMYVAKEKGKNFRVIALETRPYLQGARLTAWELKMAGIDVVIATDNSIGILAMKEKIDLAITGADRITAQGYVANKLGTYPLALVARVHNIPFYVAAPSSSFDLNARGPEDIEIEVRSPDEVVYIAGQRITPEGVSAIYYAFDITPPQLVTGIITEKGIIYPPFEKNIRRTIG
ncbi:S-methyl-5-thioribose-1-phosphate isomerase [Thermofilum pendens]|uniref:Putative methylthioribose-1-phosphate isomerase n=1 Tax=Thermofilum pendens (strain DSM 2475 / Hrk 5) TaxID=368408 RepID=A1RWS6_THEPD|nr:S-methyl-5-thioribose-1-phosphate isomerase [Thermofilum pendens]ABL77656.1 translation initiation factor 2B subunit I family (IF-2BI) [Thermofilum pendens Hrk 5]